MPTTRAKAVQMIPINFSLLLTPSLLLLNLLLILFLYLFLLPTQPLYLTSRQSIYLSSNFSFPVFFISLLAVTQIIHEPEQ